MKKIYYVIMTAILGMTFLLSGCGYKGTGNEVTDVSTTNSMDKSYDALLIAKCETLEEMVNFVLSDYHQGSFVPKNIFEHPTQKKNPDVFTVYTFENIPEGYELTEVTSMGGGLDMEYKITDGTGDDFYSTLSLSWGFGNPEYFEDYTPGAPVFESFYLTPSEKYPGKWEGSNGISWGENGYLFSARIPAELYGTFDLKLKEVTFPRG